MKTLLTVLVISLSSIPARAAIVNDNCASDQSAAVQAAIDARTGIVTLPVGCIAISRPIYARSWITLRGAAKRLTTLRALPGFQGKALVIVGTNLEADRATDRQIVFDSMVSDLTLDTNAAPAGTSCAYVAGAQEGSGLERDLCIGVRGATS